MKKRKEEERLFIRRFVEILAIYKEKRMRCAITWLAAVFQVALLVAKLSSDANESMTSRIRMGGAFGEALTLTRHLSILCSEAELSGADSIASRWPSACGR